MSRINFEDCNTLSDLARLHGDRLRGKALLQFYGATIEDTVNFPSPIHDFESTTSHVTFTTEDAASGLMMITFPKKLEVITSIYEYGDIWWSPDNYKKSYFSIDNMADDFFAQDPVLKESMLVPASVM